MPQFFVAVGFALRLVLFPMRAWCEGRRAWRWWAVGTFGLFFGLTVLLTRYLNSRGMYLRL